VSPSLQPTGGTWMGIAQIERDLVAFEGALGPWTPDYENARVLVMDGAVPIAWIRLSPQDVNSSGVSRALDEAEVDSQIPVSPRNPEIVGTLCIAVCTRDRPEMLRICLERLLRIQEANANEPYDVLVVDNAPRSDANLHVIKALADKGLRVERVVEPRPGLSKARNAALEAASTDFVAFTDDDALPDHRWASALHAGFSEDDRIGIVTGLAAPAEIVTTAQALFEQKVNWSDRLEAQTFSMDRRETYDWPFPYSAGHLGAGVNFALRRTVGVALGGFDEALGAGTRTASGEDNEMFVRVLRAGHALRYEPAAIVWHVHRRTDAELRSLLYSYGKGLSAAAVREFLEPGRLDMVSGTIRGAWNLSHHRRGELDSGMPTSHLIAEVAGVLVGPVAYAAERLAARKHTNRSN